MKKILIVLMMTCFISCKCNTSRDNGKGEDDPIELPESDISWAKCKELGDMYTRAMSIDTSDEYRDSLLRQLNAVVHALEKRGIKKPDTIPERIY